MCGNGWFILYRMVTLKIKSRSPKSNQLFPPFQQCIYASLVKIHRLVQKTMNRKEATRFKIMPVWPWKLSKGHQNNQLFPYSQLCIYASLVKINPTVQKITHRNHISDISKCCCDTLKLGQGHQNLINSFPLSEMYICKLGQIHQLVRKRSYADANRIRTKNNMLWGHNQDQDKQSYSWSKLLQW